METVHYKIYQLDRSKPFGKEYVFTNSQAWIENNKNVNLDDYEFVYESTIEVNDYERTDIVLDNIYTKLNFNKPDDYHCHSLSVSDIIAIVSENETIFYFVDSMGYKTVARMTIYNWV